jgi:hypothetical protein
MHAHTFANQTISQVYRTTEHGFCLKADLQIHFSLRCVNLYVLVSINYAGLCDTVFKYSVLSSNVWTHAYIIILNRNTLLHDYRLQFLQSFTFLYYLVHVN